MKIAINKTTLLFSTITIYFLLTNLIISVHIKNKRKIDTLPSQKPNIPGITTNDNSKTDFKPIQQSGKGLSPGKSSSSSLSIKGNLKCLDITPCKAQVDFLGKSGNLDYYINDVTTTLIEYGDKDTMIEYLIKNKDDSSMLKRNKKIEDRMNELIKLLPQYKTMTIESAKSSSGSINIKQKTEALFKYYSGSGYKVLNWIYKSDYPDVVSKAFNNNEKVNQFIKLGKQAYKLLSTNCSDTINGLAAIYRGGMYKDVENLFKKGSTITSLGFLSFSYEEGVVDNYISKNQNDFGSKDSSQEYVKLVLRNSGKKVLGKNMLSSDLSKYENEKEFLVKPNQIFRVFELSAIDKSKKIYKVSLELVDGSDINIANVHQIK